MSNFMNQISSITYLAQDTFEKILRDIYEDNFFGWVADKIPSDKNMHSSIPCNLRRYIEDIGLYLNVMQQYFRDSSKTHGWDGGEFRFFYSQLYYHLGITIEFLEYFTRT